MTHLSPGFSDEQAQKSEETLGSWWNTERESVLQAESGKGRKKNECLEREGWRKGWVSAKMETGDQRVLKT